MSERDIGGLGEPIFCASGIHRDGSCSCGPSFPGEESGFLGSISHVVLLAQALSEVFSDFFKINYSVCYPVLIKKSFIFLCNYSC